jgi:Tfp pilus assembly protein PilF
MTKLPDQQTLTFQQALDLGVAHQNAGRLAEAENVYQQILKVDPNQPVALRLLGTVAVQLGKNDIAVDLITRAVAINPGDAEAYNNLGFALYSLGKLEEAVSSYNEALAVEPNLADALNNLGNVLLALARLDEAETRYRQALAVDPGFADAHKNLGFVLLMQGKLKEGWEQYAWRLKTKDCDTPVLPIEIWPGSSLLGKSIIVYAEQGVGDEIMFSSCIPDLLEQSPDKLFVTCDPRLEALFSRSFPGVIVHGKKRDVDLSWLGENEQPDYSQPIGSLPKFFRNQVEDFPERNAYLNPHPDLVKKWMGRLAGLKEGLKIGISWRGGGVQAAPLSDWQPLLSMDASFINLQYGDVSQDIATLGDIHIHDWDDNDPFTDLDNQAALLSCLDLVISVDNATVHLAGAVGARTWLLLEHVSGWRWPEAFGDLPPLYRSVRLFRQKRLYEWGDVMDRVVTSLRDLTGQGS